MAGEIINRLNVGHVVNVKLTDSATVNCQNFVDAYNYAKTLTPNGAALSSTNRVAIILQPGNYFFTTQFAIDTQFIDIIGLGAQKLERGAVPAVNFTTAQFGGVDPINVTANDVRISGISVGSRIFRITGNLPSLIIEDCVGTGSGSFAGSISGSSGTASGTFINCIGGGASFGGGSSFAGAASGTFINCTGGAQSFGSNGTSTASGTFINCTSTASGFGGGSFAAGFNCNASGTFINCTGTGNDFGGASAGGPATASGTFINCTSSGNSFGKNGVASGKFYQCRLLSGTFETVSAGGLMRNCIDGNNNIVDQ